MTTKNDDDGGGKNANARDEDHQEEVNQKKDHSPRSLYFFTMIQHKSRQKHCFGRQLEKEVTKMISHLADKHGDFLFKGIT